MPRVLGVGYDTISDILNANLALKVADYRHAGKSGGACSFARFGNIRRTVGSHVHVERGNGRSFRYSHEQRFSEFTPFSRSFRIGCHGGRIRGRITGGLHLHHLCFRNNARLQLRFASYVSHGNRRRHCHVADADCIDHDREVGAPRAADSPRLRGGYVATNVRVPNDGYGSPLVPGDMWLVDLADRIARRDPEVSRHQALVITGADGKLAGIITRADVFRALDKDSHESMTVLEAGTRNVLVTYPDEALHDASAKMLRNNIGRLPVVDRKDPGHVVGYLGRQGIMAARLRRLDEEHVREPGWIKSRWK